MRAGKELNVFCVLFFTVVFGFGPASVIAGERLDSRELLKDFIRCRASLDGKDQIIWWKGTIHSFIPDTKSEHLFDIEGYNIARVIPENDDYLLLSREVMFYKDPQTGEVLKTWLNPMTKETVEVVHVWNDPVNIPLSTKPPYNKFLAPFLTLEDMVIWKMELFLMYPSPLPRKQFPEYSQSNLYQSGELFFFRTSRSELQKKGDSVNGEVSWTRVGQWLPWMKMADRAGFLVYHCQGFKLNAGFSQLPNWLQKEVMERNMLFSKAPEKKEGRNVTSWSYFKNLLMQKVDAQGKAEQGADK